MRKHRTKLLSARLDAGYKTQNDLVEELRKETELGSVKMKIDISLETYKNIECGRSKTVDVVIALVIAKKLNQPIEKIFLPETA